MRVMKNQYQNWWTIHWLSEFQARWAGAGRAWEEGQVDYEIGKLERADFDGLSGELVGKLLDRKSTRLNSSHKTEARMPSSA